MQESFNNQLYQTEESVSLKINYFQLSSQRSKQKKRDKKRMKKACGTHRKRNNRNKRNNLYITRVPKEERAKEKLT